jgi:hypothetical protein
MTEGDNIDLATAFAGAPGRAEIERRRRVAFFLAQCDQEVGVPAGDRLVDSLRDDASFDGWLHKVLRAALASKGRLGARRYRAIWAIKNAMGRA